MLPSQRAEGAESFRMLQFALSRVASIWELGRAPAA